MNTRTAALQITADGFLAAVIVILTSSAALAQTPNPVLSFDGNGDYVSVASTADLQNPTAITVEAWVYPQRGSQNNSILVNKSDNANATSSRSYELQWIAVADSAGPGNSIRFMVFLSNGSWTFVDALAPENQWTHVAAVFSSSQGVLQLFTNGVLAKSITDATGVPLAGKTLRQTTLPVRFGRGEASPFYYARGLMDEIRIWSTARTQAEISGSMSCRLAGNETGLVGYWNFDDGNANDLTGKGHTGTLTGNATFVPETGSQIHAGCPCIPHRATATATVVNGFLVGATITDSGCGYTNPPAVLITGAGTGATATATVSGGVVTGINIVNPGSGYTGTTQIKIASPPFMPWLELAVTRVSVTLHVVLGKNYILQSSSDLTNWTQVGAKFTAQDELITQEFNVDTTGRYFKIQEVP